MTRGRKPKNIVDELAGFEVYKAKKYHDHSGEPGISISPALVRLTRSALDALNDPAAILIFFDEMRKRMLIQPTEPENENALTLRSKSGRSTPRVPCCIQRPCVVREIGRISGTEINGWFWCPGMIVDSVTPSLIFDLENMEARPK